MNKQDLINKISKTTPYTKKVVREVIDKMIYEIKESMNKEEKVNIKNFGTFEIRDMNKKVIKHFNSGKSITIPKRKRMKFKVSKNF